MYYCPYIADTIVSPQNFTSSAIAARQYNGYCLIDMLGCCRIILSHSNYNDTSFIALKNINDLYFISGSTPDSSGSHVSRLATKPQLLSELWHQRLSHTGPTQLVALAKHSTGMPSLLTMHTMHPCQACNDEKIQCADKGPISDTALLLPGTRFHLDFGFICASSADFGVTTVNRVVTSYNINNSYLIIVCAKTRQTWVFCQASKSPLIFNLERFLALNGLKSGPHYLHIDQGRELWRSNELRDVAFAAGYDFEPTGSDAASENGKVEWANGTFGAMVRCLLYSAGLHPHFWSAALVHSVYLKNHLYHKALCMTPHEAWTGEKPSLAHLRTFGALATVRKPGRRPAKADRHTAHSVLLGYGSTPKHVWYFD
jgi:hypothetical protein